MPAVIKPKTIAVMITGSTILTDTPIYLLNRGTGDRWKKNCLTDTDGQVLFNLTDDNMDGETPTAWESEQEIEVNVLGIAYATATLTLDNKQDQEVIIATTATDDGPALTI